MTVIIEHPNRYGRVSEARLLALEKRLGASLPSDYRTFLLEKNGGIPSPAGFWIVEDADGSEVHQFYGLHDGPDWLQLDRYSNIERGIPKWLLAIGDDGLGNFICIGVSDNQHGRIFFIDHELYPFHQPDAMEGIVKITDSFTQFIACLRILPP